MAGAWLAVTVAEYVPADVKVFVQFCKLLVHDPDQLYVYGDFPPVEAAEYVTGVPVAVGVGDAVAETEKQELAGTLQSALVVHVLVPVPLTATHCLLLLHSL